MSDRQRGHQSGLRSGELAVAKSDAAGPDIGFVQQHQRKVHHQAGHHHGDQLRNLNRARRAAEDVADLEILQQVRRQLTTKRKLPLPRPVRPPLPEFPETPSETMSSAAIIKVESVKPETGLFEEPMNPTRLPETVAKKNPTNQHDHCRQNRPATPDPEI